MFWPEQLGAAINYILDDNKSCVQALQTNVVIMAEITSCPRVTRPCKTTAWIWLVVWSAVQLVHLEYLSSIRKKS